MDIKQSFILSMKNLWLSKMRSILTMLGIIIGVGAVIIIISLGDGMKNMMTESFETLGTNLLYANIFGRGSSRNVKAEEMYTLTDKYPEYIKAVSPSVSVPYGIKYLSDTYSSTTVTGVNEQYVTIRNLKLNEGRYIQYIDTVRMHNICVVGSYVANTIMDGNAMGKTLKINGTTYTVVGVLAEKADTTKGSDDDVVYIPYTNATRITKNSKISLYYVSATSDLTTKSAKWAIENTLYNIYNDDDAYMVISMSEMLDMVQTIQNTLMVVLVSIAAISLLVGGIGIMNIMLVSVTERTREIGIRKSLGAKRNDIRVQFIIEAGTTSAIGGIIGILLGISLAGVIGNMIGITAIPSVMAICVSFGVSVGVGVLFGYLPANKAAKLNSIDALRYE